MGKYKATPPVEEITWFDHSANHGESVDKGKIATSLKEQVVTRSVGMRVFEDETRVTLAHEARIDADYEEAGYSCRTTIYKALIVRRTTLSGGTPEGDGRPRRKK